MNRDLDGYYFRVMRDNKWQNICWSDLTTSEMDEVLKGWDLDAVKRLAKGLGDTIREIGDTFDLTRII